MSTGESNHAKDNDRLRVHHPPPPPIRPRTVPNPIPIPTNNITTHHPNSNNKSHHSIPSLPSSSFPSSVPPPPRIPSVARMGRIEKSEGDGNGDGESGIEAEKEKAKGQEKRTNNVAMTATPKRQHTRKSSATPNEDPSTSSASSAAASSLRAAPTHPNIVPPSSSSSTSSSSSSTSSSTLADRVIHQWRAYTHKRVDDLSLDHRARQMLFHRIVQHWHQRTMRRKEVWKQSIVNSTAARYHYLKTCFAHWYNNIQQRRPIRIQHQLQLRKALEYEKYRRRIRTIKKWKLWYTRRVYDHDRIEASDAFHRRSLLRAALHSWVDRYHRIQTAHQIGQLVARLTQTRILRAGWVTWRSSQESSALARLQSGVARKFAYRSTLRRMMILWKQQVARGEQREMNGKHALRRFTQRHMQQYVQIWRFKYHRQQLLARIVHHHTQQSLHHAYRLSLQRWHQLVRRDREIGRRENIALQSYTHHRLHASVLQWRHRTRLSRLQRLMGVHAFALLQRKWRFWRKMLALRRNDKRMEGRARLHYNHHTFHRIISHWHRRASNMAKLQSLYGEGAEVWRRKALHRSIELWQYNIDLHQTKRDLKSDAFQFHRASTVHRVLTAFNNIVRESHRRRDHRKQLLRHQRVQAFKQWQSFTHDCIAYERHYRRAKRHYYLRLLRRPFLAWRIEKQRTERYELSMLMTRAGGLVTEWKKQMWQHWRERTRIQRGWKYQQQLAIETYDNRLLTDALSHWLTLYHSISQHRQHQHRADRHYRHRTIRRILHGWDQYSYQQRYHRQRLHNGVMAVRYRLNIFLLGRYWSEWKRRFAERELRRSQYHSAVLHHARLLVYHTYRAWHRAYDTRRTQLRASHQLAHRVGLREARRYMYHWIRLLRYRRMELCKNITALRYWSRRLLMRAWRGWLQYHARKQWKKGLLQSALRDRRDKLRRIGLRQWLTTGLELHERSLLIAHRNPIEPNSNLTIAQRRIALKCARHWRECCRKRREADGKMKGFKRRIVQILPFQAMMPKARALPISTINEADHSSLIPSVASSSLFSSSVDSSSHSSSFFPIPSTLGPKVRPPPRQPIEFIMEQTIQQMQTGTESMPPLPYSSHQPVYATAHFSQPTQYFSTDSHPSDSSMHSFAATHFNEELKSNRPTSMPPSSSLPTPSSSAMQLSSLEDHLQRLLAWKQSSTERKLRLRQIQQQIDNTKMAPESNDPLILEYEQLRHAVSEDADLRPYYNEQVQQVHQQIRDWMKIEEAKEKEHNVN